MNLLSLMKHKKERMYMAYMIQQHPQQISTENLAYQKRISVADNAVGCKASSFSSLFLYSAQRIQQNQHGVNNRETKLNDIHMKTENLTAAIARHDPLLADAVGKMVGYIQDRWAAPYPTKEQTDAVNAYLRSVHADGGGTMSETDIAHRRIATQKITINAIRVLDHDQLDRLQDVLNHIAADREYYMPEQRQGMGR